MLKSVIRNCGLIFISAIFVILLISGSTLASSSVVQPPTLLPSTDTSTGGTGDACIGLATMIQTGNIHLRNVPCFIKYITETIIGIAGSLSVIFVMIGGYRYVIGKDEDTAAAKKTITYALIGLAVSLLAWVIIDLVLQVATE